MTSEIKCPSCGHQFSLNEILSEELNVEKDKMRKQLNEWKANKEEEFKKEMNRAAEETRKKVTEELGVQMQALKEDARQKNEKLAELQKKEVDYLRKQNEMEERQRQFELEKEKYFLEKSREIEQSVIKREQEGFELKLKEKELQLEGMKKTIDDLKQKSEQGSMQLQGEAQELLLEAVLREKFPLDLIAEVGKGVEGADCIQTVRNSSGKECGKIIYESKRAKNWLNAWVDKLKSDMRNTGADTAILVTQCFPKDMDRFGHREGIWICSYAEVISLAQVIRHSIMQVSDARKSQENKGEKQQMLYDYMSSNEFKQKWDSIVETYIAMQKQLTDEKVKTQKAWTQRERQLEIILKNAVGFIEDVNIIGGLELKDEKLEIENIQDKLLEE